MLQGYFNSYSVILRAKIASRLYIKKQEITHQVRCLLTMDVGMGKINKIQIAGNIRKKANFQNLFVDLRKESWYTKQDRKYEGLFPVCFW